LGLMQATAVQVGVGDEPADSRQLGEPGDEFGRVQVVDQPADERWEVRPPRLAELLLVVVPVLDPRGLIRPWKLASEPERDGVVFTTCTRARTTLAAGRDPATLRDGDVMSAPVHTVTQEASALEAFQLIRTRAFRRLPVVDEDGGLVGIVTQSDLLHAMIADM